MICRHVLAPAVAVLIGAAAVAAQDPAAIDSVSACDPLANTALRQDTTPFRVSVDGTPDDSLVARLPGELQGCQDRRLEQADIQVRVDDLAVAPALNVTSTTDVAVRNQPVSFVGYTNYAAWIVRGEVRIFAADASTQSTPLAVLPSTDASLEFTWNTTAAPEITEVRYVLRVYDAGGAFDETAPGLLDIVDRSRPAGDEEPAEREAQTGYGKNNRLIANIPVAGGAVTVNGYGIGQGMTVTVMGRPVPVGDDGRFAAQELLPTGPHVVTVTVTDASGTRKELVRDIDVRRQTWFSVGMADLTVGSNSVDGPAALVTGDDSRRYSEDAYVSGRMAFYLKGQLGTRTLLTASADTREKPVEDLFSNFGRRDPHSLLRRLDPNTVYPEYGDDATLIVDAPTQGNAYLRLDHRDSHVMWGSFLTRLAGADLVNYSRGLYGGELQHRSGTTRFGERRAELTAFAADPGTIGAREEFRGTGGSLYYLQNQDILLGSELVRVEVRDRDSDIVMQSTTLVPGQDYELNALQGRVTLGSPLSSVADRPDGVRVGALDGNPVYLVVTYEFTPGLTRADNLTTGGRASYWAGDHVRIGATGYQQGGDGVDQLLLGGDLTLRYAPGSYIKLERARSEGAGSGSLFSLDGGFGFTGIPQVAGDDVDADASRVELGVNLEELSSGRQNGKVTAYWLDRAAGYSAPGQLTTESIEQFGFAGDVPLSSRFALSAKADLRDGAATGESRAVELGSELGLSRELGLRLGIRHDDRDAGALLGASTVAGGFGARNDALGRLAWDPVNDEGTRKRYGVYGLAQLTVSHDDSRSENDRYGVGGRYRLNNRTELKGEITDGTGGTGGLAGADFRVSDRSSLYLNYRVDVDRPDQGVHGRTGSLVTGGKVRFSDATSVFAEQRHESSDVGQSGWIHAFGLDIAARDRWTWGLKLEQGRLHQSGIGDLDRRAASLGGGYRAGALRWGSLLEYRTEDTDLAGTRESWLVKNTMSVQATRDWRVLGRANFAISDGQALALGDAEYSEIVTGLAYRPVHNNRVNALMRYTFLHDVPSPGQLGPRLQANPYAQRSHVLSADGIFALTNRLSLGGKVGHRVGEIRDNAIADAPWVGSSAWLGIVRTNWHVIRAWDVLAEARTLTVTEAEDARSGFLLAAYRHLSSNFKVGLGYNFTDYSEDLTDLSYRSRGWFVNIIGQH